MSTLKTLYSTVFRSNITYLTYVFVGAIALDTVYSKGVDTAWEIANSGVSLRVAKACSYLCPYSILTPMDTGSVLGICRSSTTRLTGPSGASTWMRKRRRRKRRARRWVQILCHGYPCVLGV